MATFKFNKFSDALSQELTSDQQQDPQPEMASKPMKPTKKENFSDLLAAELTGVENEPGFPKVAPQTPKVEPIAPKNMASFEKPNYHLWTKNTILSEFKLEQLSNVAKHLGFTSLSEMSKDAAALKVFLGSLDEETFWQALQGKHIDLVASKAGLKNAWKSTAPSGELRHKQFDEIFRWLTSETGSGIFQPVWLYGGPGGGKSTIAEQIAPVLCEFAKQDAKEKGLDIPISDDFLFPMTCSDTTTKSDLLGFKSAAHGVYTDGVARRAFEHGGLLFMDEIDNSNTSFLVSANALKSQRFFRFPDGVMVKRHPYFFVLAGANTLGTGSTNGFQRKAQDAAARDRYAKVHFDYDEVLERKLAKHDSWVSYVQKVRKYVNTLAKCAVHITPRASYGGAAALRNGIKPENVAHAFIFVEFSKDIQQSVLSSCGMFKG
jgi:hypothetical protein